MTDETIRTWTAFLEEIADLSAKLRTETGVLSDAVVSLTAELEQRLSETDGWQWEPGRIDSLRTVFGEHARSVLMDTLGAHSKLRADERLSRAFGDYRADLRDATSKLPSRAEVSVRALAENFATTIGPAWKLWFARALNRRRTLPLRALVLESLGLEAGLDSQIEGRIYLFHAQADLALLDPWQMLRYQAFRRIRGEPEDKEGLERTRSAWKQQAIRRAREADSIRESMEKALTSLPLRLTQVLATGSSRSSDTARQRRRRQRHEAYWGRQRRAVRSLIETERAIVQLGNAASQMASEFVSSSNEERQAVGDELSSVLLALREWKTGEPNPIPPPQAQLTSASQRGEHWARGLGRQVEQLLPVKVESLEPRRALASWRAPWRDSEPRQMFLGAVGTCGELAVEAFSSFERSHKSVIREIERAREVVTFGIETANTDPESGTQIAQESITNAISLLEHENEEMAKEAGTAEPGIVMATASCFYQFHLAFEQGTLSLASHLAKEGGYRAFTRVAHFLMDWIRRTGRLLMTALRRATDWFLIRIGWRAPQESGLEPVERWRYLGEDFAIDLKPRHLPLIYARLFRVQPVEDPRFLIAREVEMAALAEADSHWKTGRQASVVVIGERGSGKTSLLNCASIRLFSNVRVVRARFTERILTAEGVRSFLRQQLGFEGEEGLVDRIKSTRQVIVLEEVERGFLRVVGGSEGVRELLRIIAATSSSTLWILGMTAAAFRFLDSAEGVGEYFSHRINASSVEPDQLRSAILQRHNLSGLRLEFIPPTEGNGIKGWIRRKVGTGEGPESVFFRRLYLLSGGVYRSAFGLWLRHIDRAESGVVYMESPEEPDYEALIRGLAAEDLFTLQMIRQHGSLTMEEHARIFDSDLESSQASIVHLLGREIIEPEPDAPGYRVRPEAGALVRSALSGQNLI